MDFVEDASVVELVDLVEDDDVGWVVVGVEAFEKEGLGCGLAVNVEGMADASEDSVVLMDS